MAKPCEFKEGFMRTASERYNAGDASYELFYAVLDEALRNDRSCAKPILDGATGQLRDEITLDITGRYLIIPPPKY